MSSVLEAAPPQFTADEAAQIAADLFGVQGTASALGSERDQAFLLEDGGRGAVLKISNAREDEGVLDLEDAAIAHVAAVDPDLPVARPLAARATFDGHQVRLFERRNGHKGGPELDDAAVREVAAVHARLCLALRSFFHPAAGRELLWNLRTAPQLRPLLDGIAEPARRALVARTLDRFEERVLPEWDRLRGQVVHGDFNLDNLLLDEGGRVAGILDFGDCCHTALAADLAVAIASFLRGRPDEDVFRVARIALDGFASRVPLEPLEPLELELLGDLVAARLAAIVSISAWRAGRFPENAAYIEAWDDDSWRLLELLDRLDPGEVARELGARPAASATRDLARRRDASLGGFLTPLTYTRPVHAVRAEGVWIHQPDGQCLLDAYNNVPVVGHCHPRVTEAVVRQTRLGATNARYLAQPLVELAERLLATLPGLDTVLLVNSGSEANDLAWRLAAGATGHTGALVTEHAYHGVTEATTALSPEEWPPQSRPAWVARIPPPGSGADLGAALGEALGTLEGGLAATFLDGSLMSDGIYVPDSAELRLLVERTHAAGGLYVADEVQAGHGRLGPELWSFMRHGIAPDVVTLGKPMGNGYPVAAVVTRRELAERFPYSGRTFSTFGGNPVAAAAALAVLDVLEDERLPERAAAVGERLRRAIEALGKSDVVEVRGRGLLAGVQLSSGELAGRVTNELREAGILVGLTGRDEDVLKIRPPLVFDNEHAELLLGALGRIMG